MKDEGQHWVLTVQGYEQAQKVLAQLGKQND
jgi:hypothetical protein